MTQPIISPKVRQLFQEYFVDYHVLRTIEEAFDGSGIRCDKEYDPATSGSRRTLVQQYYHTVDWTSWKDVSKVVKLYETELREIFAPHSFATKEWLEIRSKRADTMIYWLKDDGFDWTDNKLVRRNGNPAWLEDLSWLSDTLDSVHLEQQIRRMRESVDEDPALAVGTAKELIETVCKTILEERGRPVSWCPEISILTKTVLSELKLVPEWVREWAKGEAAIKWVLRSLGTIGNDLAQLRWLYWTWHGQAAKTQPVKPRHARLAVWAAATLVTFLFETHLETVPDLAVRND